MPRTSKKLQANPSTRVAVFILDVRPVTGLYERQVVYKEFGDAWRAFIERDALCRRARIMGHTSLPPLIFRAYVPPRDLKRSTQHLSTSVGTKVVKVHVLRRYVPGPYVQLNEEDLEILKFEESIRIGDSFG